MPKNEIDINTRPGANQYAASFERIIEFSSPVGGGLISFALREDRLEVHIYHQNMTVRVTAGQEGEPVRHGNLRADHALYLAAKAFAAAVGPAASRSAAGSTAGPASAAPRPGPPARPPPGSGPAGPPSCGAPAPRCALRSARGNARPGATPARPGSQHAPEPD